MSAQPEIRYAPTKDGIDIAHQVSGDGPFTLVFVSGFVSHLDLNHEFHPYAEVLRFASVARTILFDKRGTGLSDRSLGFGSLEDRMDDVRAVMDAAEVDEAVIYGASEGGPLALLFAAQYPDRVSKLIVFGSMVRGLWAPDWPAGYTPEQGERFIEMLREQWGTGHAMANFVSGIPQERRAAIGRFERSACTPHMVEEIMRANFGIDIRSLLPTLIVHAKDDPICPVENARYLAEKIPGAKYVEGPGSFHAPGSSEDSGWIAQAILEFLGEDASSQPSDRVLATVLFTDIVGSTERAVEVGDAEWKRLLDSHDEVCRQHVARSGGKLVKTTGDGLLATFDGPSRAIDAARGIGASVSSLGLQIRAGVHTGEIERRGDDVGGIGVNIASRVAALAGADEVLASRTVRDLTVGSGLEFEDRGRHALKGVPEEWELFSVVT